MWFESHVIWVFFIEPREKQNSRPYKYLHSIRLNNAGKVNGVLLMAHITDDPFDRHRWYEIGNCDWWVVYVCVALKYLCAACIQPRRGKKKTRTEWLPGRDLRGKKKKKRNERGQRRSRGWDLRGKKKRQEKEKKKGRADWVIGTKGVIFFLIN